ncbi:hypothetical protein [Hymenobacter cellulosilyticus]|uniref:Uncharacterized protein n=1 Tax=Hymenobacter cellulosilyticus TaxID=2932248 RepID=A0A8T9Q7L1_9BACT|nr:hypothetical protein [Hymenobacter cellulosilyticus]UOQ73567.1 hypothetical protein MUN79_06455 [Hymenobacter cellulosilyticus]
MSINLLEADVVFEPSLGLRREVMAGTLEGHRLPPSVSNVRLSLKDVHIKRHGELGRAEVQVVTVVTDGISQEPIQLFSEVFENVQKWSHLPLGEGGVTLYRTDAQQIPAFLDYRILLTELDEDIRSVGNLLDAVRQDEQFAAARQALLAAAAVAAPPAALISASSDLVMNLVARVLKANKDDQMLLVRGSFDNAFDGLGTKYGTITKGNRQAAVTYQAEAVEAS